MRKKQKMTNKNIISLDNHLVYNKVVVKVDTAIMEAFNFFVSEAPNQRVGKTIKWKWL